MSGVAVARVRTSAALERNVIMVIMIVLSLFGVVSSMLFMGKVANE